MVIHVSTQDTKTTAKTALLHLLSAVSSVSCCLVIGWKLVATLIGTLELQSLEAVKNKSIYISVIDILVTLAFLGAGLILLSPWVDAVFAVQWLATAALKWLLDHIHADCANKEHCLLFFLRRLKLNLIEVKNWLVGLTLRVLPDGGNVTQSIWVLGLQFFDFLVLDWGLWSTWVDLVALVSLLTFFNDLRLIHKFSQAARLWLGFWLGCLLHILSFSLLFLWLPEINLLLLALRWSVLPLPLSSKWHKHWVWLHRLFFLFISVVHLSKIWSN